jgi:hypothetical protein
LAVPAKSLQETRFYSMDRAHLILWHFVSVAGSVIDAQVSSIGEGTRL